MIMYVVLLIVHVLRYCILQILHVHECMRTCIRRTCITALIRAPACMAQAASSSLARAEVRTDDESELQRNERTAHAPRTGECRRAVHCMYLARCYYTFGEMNE